MPKPSRKNPSRGTRTSAGTVRPFTDIPVWGVVAVFTTVTLIFFWPHISGSAWLWEDFSEFTYPTWVYASRSIAAGQMPFWNPFSFNGMPFLADLQAGFFYPVNMLMFLLGGSALGVWIAQFFILLHYPLAMVGAYLLARSLGLSRWSGVVAGLAYGLTGMLVVHMIHANMVQQLAWFPLIVLLFRRGILGRSLFHAALCGLALGIAMLSGHPQSSLYIVFFLFCLAIYLLIAEFRSNNGGSKVSIAMAVTAAVLPVVIGAGIFAIQLLPSQELASLSERADFTYEESLQGELSGGGLLTLIAPTFFGVSTANRETTAANPYWLVLDKPYLFWETAVYIGVTTLVLMLLGVASQRLGGFGWFLFGMGMFGLFYAMGDGFLIHPIFGRLPIFSSFRIPTRMAIYFSLGGAILAGAGVDRLMRGGYDRGLARVVVIGTAAIAAIALFVVAGMAAGIFNAPAQLVESRSQTGMPALLLAVATGGVVVMALRGSLGSVSTGAILSLLVVVDLALFGMGLNRSTLNPERDMYAPADAQLEQADLTWHPSGDIFRVKSRSDAGTTVPRNQGLYSGVMLYEGYNPLRLERRVPPTDNLEKAFDLLNIRYDISPGVPGGILERPTRYPHARIVYDVKMVAPGTAPEAMKKGGIDYAKTVVLEEAPGVKLDSGGGASEGTATIVAYGPERIDIRTSSKRPGILVLSEIWYPAWQVTIDGAQTKLLAANHSLRGVALPAGDHLVVMEYEKSAGAFTTGLWITLFTAISTLAAIIVLWMRRRSALHTAND